MVMDYKKFADKAVKEDSRNLFGESADNSGAPSTMRLFYMQCNPVDVEIMFPSLGAVKFYPVNELGALQAEYGYSDENFVFASCDGDAIFEKEGKIYRSLHGHYRPELLAVSFDEFLLKYIHQ